MADVAISTAMWTSARSSGFQNAIYWTSPTVGYAFGIDSGLDFVYWKTSDGGATWGSAVDIKAATCVQFGIWAKEWTTGDKTDVVVHTWYMDQASGTIFYRALDTSDDSLGTERTVVASLTISTNGAPNERNLQGIETRGGNLLLAWRETHDAGSSGFSRSVDAGVNWTARTDVFEDMADVCFITPGDETDTDDAWCFYLDASAGEISLKIYDDSGNSFGETVIVSVDDTLSGAVNMGTAHRQSDRHTILAAWNDFDNAGADLLVFDIGGSGSITAKTNIITNQAEAIECPVFINQQNDDIYVAYISGGTWGSLEDTHYQKSTDGGTTWGGEASMSVDTQDDHRNILSSNGVGDNGGRFMSVWNNDDLNDYFVNATNAVSIAAAAAGGLSIPVAMHHLTKNVGSR